MFELYLSAFSFLGIIGYIIGYEFLKSPIKAKIRISGLVSWSKFGVNLSNNMSKEEITFPINPLDKAINSEEIQRRTVAGVLESYNSNYDVLAEMVQNSVDAIEDAFLSDLSSPYLIEIHINLQKNEISF